MKWNHALKLFSWNLPQIQTCNYARKESLRLSNRAATRASPWTWVKPPFHKSMSHISIFHSVSSHRFARIYADAKSGHTRGIPLTPSSRSCARNPVNVPNVDENVDHRPATTTTMDGWWAGRQLLWRMDGPLGVLRQRVIRKYETAHIGPLGEGTCHECLKEAKMILRWS